MIVELGHFALMLALGVALALGWLGLWGAHSGQVTLIRMTRRAATLQGVLLALAYAALTWAFVDNDFSVALAARHSNASLPLVYRIAAVWGNHEGSILLWALILAGWTAAVAHRSRALDESTTARVLGVMGTVNVGFLLFTLLVSNPFERLLPAALDGQDLNPLLQDPGMAIHPPLLYMGYVGLAVPFAFAVAALIAGRLDAGWARWSRPWTTAAWCCLTLGIALGSFWAYYELGWGGWWFWDPVENASFMPWLLATALIHSLSVTEQRGALKVWTALLAIVAFSLSLLGTFIVRSGVLSSVHAFATDPARGLFILAFLAVVAGGSLALFAWRAPRVGLGGGFGPVSRESLLLVNNLLLSVAAAAVLLGTLYPLVLDALGGGKISVGPPYFNAVFIPLVAPALFLLGVGPLARWRAAPVLPLLKRLRWAAALSAAGVTAVLLTMEGASLGTALGLGLAMWIAASTAVAAWDRLRPEAGQPLRWGRWRGAPGGMLLAHFGVAVFVAGVTVVSSFSTERDLRMAPGDTADVGGWHFRLDGLGRREGPNYLALQARLSVSRSGEEAVLATLRPERRQYTASRMTMTEVAIDRGLTRDLYVALGEPLGSDSFSLRIHHKPLVNWIWGGCLLMAVGGLLAASDRRYRVRRAAGEDAGAARTAEPALQTAPLLRNEALGP